LTFLLRKEKEKKKCSYERLTGHGHVDSKVPSLIFPPPLEPLGNGRGVHTGKSSRGPLGRVIIGYDRKKGRLYRKEIRKEEEEEE
jgi:hypothetical protein